MVLVFLLCTYLLPARSIGPVCPLSEDACVNLALRIKPRFFQQRAIQIEDGCVVVGIHGD